MLAQVIGIILVVAVSGALGFLVGYALGVNDDRW